METNRFWNKSQGDKSTDFSRIFQERKKEVWWDSSLGEREELQVAQRQVPGVQEQRKPSQSFTSYSLPEHTLKGKQGKRR